MIISAEYFVTTNTQFKGNDRDFFIALIEARDAAIRKECADRWEYEYLGFGTKLHEELGNLDSDTIDNIHRYRAAIMGEE